MRRPRGKRLPRRSSSMRCPESGKATGRWELPRRRVRCLLCGRLVHLVPWGEGIIVAPHLLPADAD